jgi:hypothetical protein
MRAMAYLGFGHGAKGAYAHAQHEIARFPGTEWHWSELSEVARELSSLGPMLASTTPPPFPFQSATDPRLDNFTRGYVGDSYLVSVNTSVATLTAAGLTFAPGTPAKLVTKVAESGLAACIDSGSRFVGCNTTCLDTGSRFNDDFTPQGTHVYRLVAPPTASITSPAPNATLQGTVQVSVAAASAAPVSRVELYLDATLKGTDTTAPYQLLLDTTTALNQAHTLRAVAYDGCNAQGQQIIPVTTSNAPAPASSPNPVDGATNLPKKPTLRWTAGLNASSHKVYLGTSSNALALKATVTTPSWTSPSNLSGQTLYYWRIDEVAGNGQTTQGPVWRFTTGH